MNFIEKTFKYKIPNYLEFSKDPQFIELLIEKTGKNIISKETAENTAMYKLCSISVEGINQKIIETNVLYDLENLINDSELNQIQLFSIEGVGPVIDEKTYQLMTLFILRGIL